MRRPTPRLLLTAALMCMLVAACGGSQSEQAREDAIEDLAAQYGVDADVELDEDGNVEQLTIDRSVGGMQAQLGQNLDLPADFPADVPIYPGLSIHSVSAVPQGHMVQGTTEDDRQAVVDFLRERLLADGWTEAESNEVGPMLQMRFEKGSRITGIMLMPGNPGVVVQLSALTLP